MDLTTTVRCVRAHHPQFMRQGLLRDSRQSRRPCLAHQARYTHHKEQAARGSQRGHLQHDSGTVSNVFKRRQGRERRHQRADLSHRNAQDLDRRVCSTRPQAQAQQRLHLHASAQSRSRYRSRQRRAISHREHDQQPALSTRYHRVTPRQQTMSPSNALRTRRRQLLIPGFTRTQFPIRTCFALTTNKAQGQSFGGRIGLDLRDHCFSHGQLYVALSRNTHPGNVTVLTRESNETTRNVVYPEVLQ
ncbi:unnamed protein product [Chondrus crispus]|uniref:ATP-dependent DNA helicase n=1 Tax=Chondrus crispus TaxID=2769 RepID=R7QRK0_CHOCR|nr:unnamed protein product [Chondrus crispus]CDF41122.1 unnamed protein product [Chondrus crispus]|eukprot:XP_005711416.1 unnamed protein product [Chondrus crispus]